MRPTERRRRRLRRFAVDGTADRTSGNGGRDGRSAAQDDAVPRPGRGRCEQHDDYVDEYDGRGVRRAAGLPAPEVTPIRSRAAERGRRASPAELRRITTVHPRSYNDARVIGEAFRAGTP